EPQCPRRRQLRLLHLQPRPVPRRARGAGRGRAQRPGRGGRHHRRSPGPRGGLAGPVHSRRGGDLRRSDAPDPRGGHPHPRRLPRPPGARPGLRRARGAPRARARQDHGDRARRHRALRRAAEPADRRALPLARRLRVRPAGLPRRDKPRRRGPDGPAPRRSARRGGAVPPRIDPHRRREAAARQLPQV
ncbi:MAG: Anthranilate synthase, amidotransferase component @ Para-aminobenzoate synthase, amidotransferase component, partial [uncultured Solirubrobacteraceae bacterium]